MQKKIFMIYVEMFSFILFIFLIPVFFFFLVHILMFSSAVGLSVNLLPVWTSHVQASLGHAVCGQYKQIVACILMDSLGCLLLCFFYDQSCVKMQCVWNLRSPSVKRKKALVARESKRRLRYEFWELWVLHFYA